MSTKRFSLAIVLFCFGANPCLAFEELAGVRQPFTEIAELSNFSLQAIQTAMPIFRKKMDWKNYKISVAESESAVMVEFWQPEQETTSSNVLAVIETGPNGRTLSKDDAPDRKLTVTLRNGSFQVRLDKRTLRPTWNSVDGYN